MRSINPHAAPTKRKQVRVQDVSIFARVSAHTKEMFFFVVVVVVLLVKIRVLRLTTCALPLNGNDVLYGNNTKRRLSLSLLIHFTSQRPTRSERKEWKFIFSIETEIPQGMTQNLLSGTSLSIQRRYQLVRQAIIIVCVIKTQSTRINHLFHSYIKIGRVGSSRKRERTGVSAGSGSVVDVGADSGV